MSSSISSLCSNVSVIVRSANERTEALCLHIIRQQVPGQNIVVIHERPFGQAVRRSLEIGQDLARDWTLCVDADILLRSKAVSQMCSLIEVTSDDVFAVSGWLSDKLLCRNRVGMSIYRTRLFNNALRYAQDIDDDARPETLVKSRMKDAGFPFVVPPESIVGVHDFDQFYSDIYRKVISHTQKHPDVFEYIPTIWRRLAEQDADYRVALWGYRAGLIFDDNILVDRGLFPEEIDGFLRLAGLQEKSNIDISTWASESVEQIVNGMSPAPEYLAWRREKTAGSTWLRRINHSIETLGPLRSVPWLIGKSMERAGVVLQAFANSAR